MIQIFTYLSISLLFSSNINEHLDYYQLDYLFSSKNTCDYITNETKNKTNISTTCKHNRHKTLKIQHTVLTLDEKNKYQSRFVNVLHVCDIYM